PRTGRGETETETAAARPRARLPEDGTRSAATAGGRGRAGPRPAGPRRGPAQRTGLAPAGPRPPARGPRCRLADDGRLAGRPVPSVEVRRAAGPNVKFEGETQGMVQRPRKGEGKGERSERGDRLVPELKDS
ncbi:PREDICTED: translation initiation factor IF-2-like, partial [Chinchilla lanigera]|uniref:translation initiation factor IF-2-like n=1 Tax=Chinchilla lanigera TaxID=34839 RepID=UPI000697A237